METPERLQALLDAYTQSTGLPVSLSYERRRVLSDIHSRGITPDDVRGVLRELHRLVRANTKGYCESSLDWRNAMANVDTLEERTLRLRQRTLRMARPRKAEPVTRAGITRLEVLPDPDPAPVDRAMVANSLRSFANDLEKAS